jgi:hypothetical protein
MNENFDSSILRLTVIKLNNILDRLITDCLDESGKPKAPDSRLLMKTRGYLSPHCANALTKRETK